MNLVRLICAARPTPNDTAILGRAGFTVESERLRDHWIVTIRPDQPPAPSIEHALREPAPIAPEQHGT